MTFSGVLNPSIYSHRDSKVCGCDAHAGDKSWAATLDESYASSSGASLAGANGYGARYDSPFFVVEVVFAVRGVRGHDGIKVCKFRGTQNKGQALAWGR